MSLPPPAPDSIALVAGARDALGVAGRGTHLGDPRRPAGEGGTGPDRTLPRWLVLPLSKRMMAR
jgi:hypothetical protein